MMFNRNFPLFNSFGGFYPRGNDFPLSNLVLSCGCIAFLLVLLFISFLADDNSR